MKISIIAAVAENWVIGLNRALPWHLPADLRHFQRLTMGHHLLMGRKTFQSLTGHLSGRTIVVISRNPGFSAEGVSTAGSLAEAIELVEGDEEVFIAGGEQIYAEALFLADRMYLTLIHHEFEGDTHFPEFDKADWRLIENRNYPRDEENPFSYSFLTYERHHDRAE